MKEINKLYIVMPAYNEEDNIVSVINQWYPVVEKTGPDSRLVIFDDGSKDNTYAVMQALKSNYPQLIVETKPNSGHGATCVYAYHYAVDAGADYIFQTDSDGQTDPEDFWQFGEERENFDIGIGHRNIRKDGLSRVFVSFVLRSVIRIIFRIRVIDSNSPFRLMNRASMTEYLKIVPSDFFLSNVLISIIAVKKQQSIAWKPVSFKPRRSGKSLVNIKSIVTIGIRAWKDFKRIRKSNTFYNHFLYQQN
jgi:glycosyltransferase involved in cell wall biosynthesis